MKINNKNQSVELSFKEYSAIKTIITEMVRIAGKDLIKLARFCGADKYLSESELANLVGHIEGFKSIPDFGSMKTVTLGTTLIQILNDPKNKGDAWLNINTFSEITKNRCSNFETCTIRELLQVGIYGYWTYPIRKIKVSSGVEPGCVKFEE